MFSPRNLDLELMLKSTSKGFLGVVLSVESSMVDLTEAYWTGLTYLSKEHRKLSPDLAFVRELAGLPLKDAFVALGWRFRSVEEEMMAATLVYNVMNDFIEKNQLQALPGVSSLLDTAIVDGNQVAVISNLPRELAVKALVSAHLSPILQGRVPENHLLCPFRLAPTEQYYALERYEFLTRHKQYLQACGVLQRAPVQCVGIDTQREAIIEAKRVGMSAVGVRDSAQSGFLLRGADVVVDSLAELRGVEGLYRLVRKNLEVSLGPAQQLSGERIGAGGGRRRTIAPVLEPGSKLKGEYIGRPTEWRARTPPARAPPEPSYQEKVDKLARLRAAGDGRVEDVEDFDD
eukprot:gene24013-29061_t